MRFREDYYTLCPECDARISLTLAARLQATRLGSSCHCDCGHEWVCIGEWVSRDQSVSAGPAPQIVPAGAPPRPHLLPTYQPPAPAQNQSQPVVEQVDSSLSHLEDSAVPIPHAFPAARPVNQHAPRPADPFGR